MRRLSFVAVAVSFVGLACFDARTPTGPHDAPPLRVTTLNACSVPTQAELEALVDLAFQTSPSPSAVKGQLNGVFNATTPEDTKTAAIKVIEFIYRQFRDNHGSFLSEEKVTEFLNSLACYAGLNLDFGNPNDTWIVDALDVEKVFVTQNGQAAIRVPAKATDELTIIAIVPVGWTNTNPGTGPLNTKLDQYAGFYKYTKSNPSQFNSPVIISLCTDPSVPTSVFNYLAIGKHAEGEGDFEILPDPDTEAGEEGVPLTCEGPDDVPEPEPEGSAASAFSPRGTGSDVVALVATRGPVSGATFTFTTMGTLDRRGCVSPSCATTTFSPIDWGTFLANPSAQSCVGFPVNSQVPANCRPSILIQTRLGTVLNDVPVDFEVKAGGGSVARFNALATPDCVLPFGLGPVEVPTSEGVATACWTLGGVPGLNTVRATPRHGGDASDPSIIFVDETGADMEYYEWNLQATVDFIGFFSPINNIPAVNSVKAGNSVPIKFSLGGAFPATGIFESGYPRSVEIHCSTKAVIPNTVIFSGTSGGSSLNYSTSTGQYTYSWKTEKPWAAGAGTCRQLELKFNHDPTGVHSAWFSFAK